MKIMIYITFFVPLVVLPSSFIFPFIVPKILLFRSLVVLLLIGYILLLYQSFKEYKPKITLLTLALLIFIISFAISTFSGVDAYHSFWDNHERMLGLFTIIHYVIYYFVCSAIFKTWVDWRRALRIFLFAGSIVMFIGVLQHWDPELLLNQGSDRVRSTLGNAIYVGGYGLFLSFVSLLLMAKEKNLMWSIAEGLMGLLAIFGLFFSGTRGSMLGFLVGVFVLMVGYFLIIKDRPKIRLILLGLIIASVGAIGIMYGYRQTSFVSNIPTLGRLFNASLMEGTGSTRLIAWQIAVEGWKDRPIFGWGPNNFFYAFNKYYNPKSLEFGYQETWFDNAHNIVLNTLAVQGAFGLISYLGLFGLALLMIAQAYRKKIVDKHIAVFGAAFLAAHLAQNLTVFENPTSYLYFMFWLAMINSLAGVEFFKKKTAEEEEKPRQRRAIGFSIIAGASLIAFLFIFIFNIQPARANKKTLKAMIQLNRGVELGIAAVESALAFPSPHIDDIRSDLARVIIELIGKYNQKIEPQKTAQLLDLAGEALKKNISLHPFDIRTYIALAQLDQLRFATTKQPMYIVEAEYYMKQALNYSPKRQQLVYNLVSIELQLGKIEESIAMLKQSIDDDPIIGEGWWRLIWAYKLTGQNDKAIETIGEAKTKNIIFDASMNSAIEQILAEVSEPTTGTAR